MEQGEDRVEDRLGNIEADTADTAAGLSRRHQPEAVVDIKRALVDARELWYPIVLQLHQFKNAISRVAVNQDGRGGTSPVPLVWDQGSKVWALGSG